MTLHFHSRETMRGESEYLNICFEKENYNFNIYPDVRYIEVDRADLDAIYKECDFNCYWHSDDLQAEHDDKNTPERQAGAFWREFLPR